MAPVACKLSASLVGPCIPQELNISTPASQPRLLVWDWLEQDCNVATPADEVLPTSSKRACTPGKRTVS